MNEVDFVNRSLVALSRYQTITLAEDAWQIDYDTVEEYEAKPTKSAIRVKDLLETITGRCFTPICK